MILNRKTKTIKLLNSQSVLSGTIIKFLPLDILGISHRTSCKNKNAVYRLQISPLVPEIFKFEECVKCANGMTDDAVHSTQYYLKYINGSILANLKCRPLKLGRLIVLQKTQIGRASCRERV